MTDLPANAKPRGTLRRILFAFASVAKPLVRHPATNVILGFGLVLTGLLELVEGAIEEFETFVQALHGIVLFGVVTTLRGLLELIESAEIFALSDLELEGELRTGSAGDEISHHPHGAAPDTPPAPHRPPDSGTV
ncbi:MAG TPA: hypothetical protein DIU07_14675 [Rhodobacteraceae bacterium]|nr:hypothetical protein [Paracoccaceae bacterium]